MKTFILFLACSLIFLAPSHPLRAQESVNAASGTTATPLAKIDPAKVAEIRQILDRSGTAKLMKQMSAQIFAIFEKQHPEVPPRFWQKMEGELSNGELLEQLIPVYDKYYTLDDLKALNAFYSTPTGQKMITLMPQVMHDSMQIGQVWGRDTALRIGRELQAERGTAGVAPGAGSSIPK